MQGTPKKLHQSPKKRVWIFHGGSHQAAKGVHFPPHRHSNCELVYYRSGALECVTEGRRRAGYPGLVWLTRPGVTHAERAVAAYANFFVSLAVNETEDWPEFVDDDADGSLGRICQQIAIESNRPGKERPRMLELLSEQLACLLDRVSSETVRSRPAHVVARAERFIEERCAHPLTVEAIARAAAVSPSTLRAHFHAERSRSPRAHLQQVRLARAIGFLRTSTLKLDAIAELCGYDSASHLTRCVKKATGKTPGRIRTIAYAN
jgi:AraC-like DNA-binding protein